MMQTLHNGRSCRAESSAAGRRQSSSCSCVPGFAARCAGCVRRDRWTRLHPDRIGHLQRQFQQLPAHHRCQRNPAGVQALDVVQEVAAIALGQVEQCERADVHRGLGCLEMQNIPSSPLSRFISIFRRCGGRIRRIRHSPDPTDPTTGTVRCYRWWISGEITHGHRTVPKRSSPDAAFAARAARCARNSRCCRRRCRSCCTHRAGRPPRAAGARVPEQRDTLAAMKAFLPQSRLRRRDLGLRPQRRPATQARRRARAEGALHAPQAWPQGQHRRLEPGRRIRAVTLPTTRRSACAHHHARQPGHRRSRRQPVAADGHALYRLVAHPLGSAAHAMQPRVKQLRARPPVPMSCLYSDTDGSCRSTRRRSTATRPCTRTSACPQPLRARLHAVVLWIVADRLAQPEGQWRPFEPEGHAGTAYRWVMR